MRFHIDYNPDPAEIRKAILKAYSTAVRAKYTMWADHEIHNGRKALEQRIAEITATGGDLTVELAHVFAAHGPDALTSSPESGDEE